VDRYAMREVERAQELMDGGLYGEARARAELLALDYPDSLEAVARAREIAGRAQNELSRQERQNRELAYQYVEQGRAAYQQALVFYRDIFDVQRRDATLLSTPKRDAIRHFEKAISYFEAAIRIDPTLTTQEPSPVGPDLAESRRYLAELQAPPPQLGFNQRLRPRT
jgi:tetratricopeptide (TPR) repeat protein